MATRPMKHRRKSIQNSDPGKILDLVMNLTDEHCSRLQVKINTYLQEECEAELVFQIVVYEARLEASIETIGINVLPRTFKLTMSHKLVEVIKAGTDGFDYFTNFNADFQKCVSPYLPKDSNLSKKRIVLMPIMDKPFSVIVCVVSPKVQEEHVVILNHEASLFFWPTLKKSISLEWEKTLKQKCQQLLRVARRLFTRVASLDTLLHIAMDQAKLITKAEHCSVLLLDIDTMELVGTGKCENQSSETRFSVDKGITGSVIKTGLLVNAKELKDYPQFDPKIDSQPGVTCKTLLCFPIRDQTGILGVGQLINKVGDPYFDAMDEEMALAFSIYCGVCVVHAMVYQKIQEAHIRNSLANELVMYHMKVSDNEVSRLTECKGFHNVPQLSSLFCNPRGLPPRELPCFVFKFFVDLGFDKKFNLKPQKLARFILQVKKGYRDVPYHNWNHGFSVAQFAYAALLNYKLVQQGYFTELQAMMFLISGLVHDLDHRGTTNSFQIQGQTTLAALYSSEGSVMERHHLAQALSILNTEGSDLLESLPRRDYDRALIMLRDYILASDLANYYKLLNEYKTIAFDYHKDDRTHNAALMSLMMNAADLSDQLKDWASVKKTASEVLTEFFKQGDDEKTRGDLPVAFMDRSKCFIPELEIQFIKSICIPLFELIGKIIPKVKPSVAILAQHAERWKASKPIFAEVPIVAGLAVLLSPELDQIIDHNLKEMREHPEEAEEEGAAEPSPVA